MGKHIIQRKFVDITAERTEEAFRFQNALSDVCKNKLIPAMERLFDAVASDDEVVRIPKLVIDVGDIPFESWEQALVDRVIAELTNKLASTSPSTKDESRPDSADESVMMISEGQNLSACLLHFLRTGVLPWFSSIKSQAGLNQLMKESISNDSFRKELLKLLATHGNSVERLVAQFDAAVADTIIHNLEANTKVVEAAKHFAESLTRQLDWNLAKQRRIVDESLLHWVLAKRSDASVAENFGPVVNHILSRCSEDEIRKVTVPTSDSFQFKIESATNSDVRQQERLEKSKPVEVQDIDCFYVTNAGLVLLHPFLPALFSQVGYTHNGEWRSDEICERALALTQFLISGDHSCPEFDLILNKVLLGYPFSRTVPAEQILSDFEKAEATDLLASVIGHWAALRSTSVEGLRSTFLRREGKLSSDKTRWLLQVEQKTVDILLAKLPWSFSLVKTPWMDQMLHVEWA